MNTKDFIIVKKAKQHNLKSVSLNIPKNKLVVFSGVSGSGKTSLAFNTIYAEGQRRYVESMSSYARQFLHSVSKADVESIEGLSPSISIDQKSTSHNPRSTVGTVTEIYDYLRLLFSRIGNPHCPKNHGIIQAQTVQEIVDQINTHDEGQKIEILSPVVRSQKGGHHLLVEQLRKESFLRIRIDGVTVSLDDEININKNQKHNVEIVIDRLILNKEAETNSRLYEAVEVAANYGRGLVLVNFLDKEEVLYSQKHSCKKCGFSISDLEPRLFSFNSPVGACSACKGLGVRLEVDTDILVPDKSKTLNAGAIEYIKNIIGTMNIEWQNFKKLCDHYNIDLNTPYSNFTPSEVKILMRGSDEEIHYVIVTKSGNRYEKYDYIEGIARLIERRYMETSSEGARKFYKKFMSDKKCLQCLGKRLNEEALSVKLNDINIDDFVQKDINDAVLFTKNLKLTDKEFQIAKLVLNEILHRLEFLQNVGLSYLNLSRSSQTLSGGEAQRIRLATQIGSHLTGVLYVLDEPSIGLHQKDNKKLIETLKKMRDLGNTLIVVEHDEETLESADWIVDLGVGAGIHGGNIVAEGTPEELMENDKSLTGQYMAQKKTIPIPRKRRGGNSKKIEIKGAKGNNLANINVTFPLGKFICVTGVSGSGKSTLINETLYKGLLHEKKYLNIKPAAYKEIKGSNYVDKIINISQDPIGRTPRSNPATYTGVFNEIRDVFADTPESKIRGYLKGRFSFNVRGGRCEKCEGDGVLRISMNFLPDVFVECEECKGKRYNNETLQIRYKGKNIFDILNMTIEKALIFWENHPKIMGKLNIIFDVGLGYIKLGQPATQLSGGEAQRVKLATFLQKKPTGKSIYIMDEPTTGLHTDDVKKLIEVLDWIVNNGDTVVVIEHNLEVIKVADYIIDLGPDGGQFGGEVVTKGTPEQIVEKQNGYTALYLQKILKKY